MPTSPTIVALVLCSSTRFRARLRPFALPQNSYSLSHSLIDDEPGSSIAQSLFGRVDV